MNIDLLPYYTLLDTCCQGVFIALKTQEGVQLYPPLQIHLPPEAFPGTPGESFESFEVQTRPLALLADRFPELRHYRVLPLGNGKQSLIMGTRSTTPLNTDQERCVQSIYTLLQDQLNAQGSDDDEELKTTHLLMAQICHDFRSPLTSLSMLTEEIVGQPLETAEALWPHIQNLSHRLRDTIGFLDQVLLWTKNKLNQHPVQSTFDLHQWLKEVKKNWQLTLQDKELQLISKVPPQTLIHTDAEICQMVIQSLIINAIKFTEKGIIEVSYKHHDDQHHIQIKDSGPGLNERILEKIQNQAKANTLGTRGETGRGMGLILSHAFLRALQGSLSVQNQATQGTQIDIYLPYIPVESAPEPQFVIY